MQRPKEDASGFLLTTMDTAFAFVTAPRGAKNDLRKMKCPGAWAYREKINQSGVKRPGVIGVHVVDACQRGSERDMTRLES